MIVLALDTTGPDCSVCLRRDAEILAYASDRIGRGHAERLAPMVADAFAAASLSPERIDRVAVCTGPGSFTGLRVALSLAKGFALPRQLPVLGLDALAVEAARLAQDKVTLFRDVKRGQVFAALYRSAQADAPPRAMTMEAAQALANEHETDLLPAEHADMRVLAMMAMTADPGHCAALPLYARAPDAKLPGGKTLTSS